MLLGRSCGPVRLAWLEIASASDDERGVEPFQSFVLDLSDSLTGNAQYRSDFPQGHRGAVLKTVSQPQDGRFALVEYVQELAQFFLLVRIEQFFVRPTSTLIFDDICKIVGVLQG